MRLLLKINNNFTGFLQWREQPILEYTLLLPWQIFISYFNVLWQGYWRIIYCLNILIVCRDYSHMNMPLPRLLTAVNVNLRMKLIQCYSILWGLLSAQTHSFRTQLQVIHTSRLQIQIPFYFLKIIIKNFFFSWTQLLTRDNHRISLSARNIISYFLVEINNLRFSNFYFWFPDSKLSFTILSPCKEVSIATYYSGVECPTADVNCLETRKKNMKLQLIW